MVEEGPINEGGRDQGMTRTLMSKWTSRGRRGPHLTRALPREDARFGNSLPAFRRRRDPLDPPAWSA